MSEIPPGSPDPEAVMNQAIETIKTRYPWQFKCLLPYGLAVGPGWHDEIQRVFDFVDQLLTDPRDRALFSWRQVKEKFGGLRMYAQYGCSLDLTFRDNDQDRHQLIDVVLPAFIDPTYLDTTDDIALRIPNERILQIQARIDEASERCSTICENCGASGKSRN